MIEVIKDQKEELAIIIDQAHFTEGVQFITPEHYPLQCGILNYEKGESARPHVHLDIRRVINKK